MIYYRDRLELEIDGAPHVFKTREGHVVEEYLVDGVKGFFVSLNGTAFCAHGPTLEQAITDALWKDESKRPSIEALKEEILKDQTRLITLNEFRVITGACLDGCMIALKRKGLDGSPMVAKDILKNFPEWGRVLCDKLGLCGN